jgi:hypothetical protein
MRHRTLALLLAAVSFTACVTSLHPLYTNAELVEEPALVGLWADASSKETWTVSAAKDKSYRAVVFDGERKTAAYIVHLVRLGDSLFLDAYPESAALSGLDAYGSNFLPTHSFFRVLELKPRLKIAAISDDWIKATGKMDSGAGLRHELVGNDVVMTGSTQELQALLRQAVRDAKAFPSVDELIRLR